MLTVRFFVIPRHHEVHVRRKLDTWKLPASRTFLNPHVSKRSSGKTICSKPNIWEKAENVNDCDVHANLWISMIPGSESITLWTQEAVSAIKFNGKPHFVRRTYQISTPNQFRFSVVSRHHEVCQIPGQVEIVPTNLPELSKPSRAFKNIKDPNKN